MWSHKRYILVNCRVFVYRPRKECNTKRRTNRRRCIWCLFAGAVTTTHDLSRAPILYNFNIKSFLWRILLIHYHTKKKTSSRLHTYGNMCKVHTMQLHACIQGNIYRTIACGFILDFARLRVDNTRRHTRLCRMSKSVEHSSCVTWKINKVCGYLFYWGAKCTARRCRHMG